MLAFVYVSHHALQIHVQLLGSNLSAVWLTAMHVGFGYTALA
jgi:hypothetical protein